MTKRHRAYDVAIIGLGLAGATLAWRVHRAGLSVLIIDDADASSASRVAAGLVTPVTGAKLKPQPRYSELADIARDHYERVAELTGARTYFERAAVRLLGKQRELDAFAAMENSGEVLLGPFDAALPDGIRSAGVPVIMPAAGRLAMVEYVDATRRCFAGPGNVICATVSDASVTAAANHVEIPSLCVTAGAAVFCRGHRESNNAHFKALRWRAAKGQVLELDCPGFDRRFTIHGEGIWLTATSGTRVLAGATYEWDELDTTVTTAARNKLVTAVDSILALPYTIVDQRAAVRPIVEGRMPVLGQSGTSERIWLMNGLGSKGALFAPTIARHLVSAMTAGNAIPEAFSLAHRVGMSS